MAVNNEKRTSVAAHAPRQLSVLRFYDGQFVLNTVSGMFYRLTPAADYLLRSYDAGVEVRQFASLIQTRYGVDRASAIRDVELLLNQFVALGLFSKQQLQSKGAGNTP